MAQTLPTDFPIDPGVTSGTELADILNRFQSAQDTSNAGATAPASTYPGMLWLDTSAGGNGVLKMRDAANAAWVVTFNSAVPPVTTAGGTFTGSISVVTPAGVDAFVTAQAMAGRSAGFIAASNGAAPYVGSFDFYQNATGEGTIWQRANQPIRIGTNNAERVRVNADGTVTMLGATLTVSPAAGQATILVKAVAAATAGVSIAGNGSVSGTSSFDVQQNAAGSALVWQRGAAPLIFGTNGVEAMRLAADGVLLHGTAVGPQYGGKQRLDGGLELSTNPQLNIHNVAAPFELVNRSNTGMRLYGAGSACNFNAMAGGGNSFGSVQAHSSYLHTFYNDGNVSNKSTIALCDYATTGAVREIAAVISVARSPRGAVSMFGGYDSTGGLFDLRFNGGLGNYASNNQAYSDRRVKANFTPAGPYLDKLCAIPVQTFTFQGQSEDRVVLGVTAQDVQAVAPELVVDSGTEFIPPTPEGGEAPEPISMLAVYSQDMQYAILKALQELRAQFDAYVAAHP